MIKLLESRRSIRKYTTQEVSKEEILKVIQAGLYSPTSKNSKSCEFIIVRDKNLLSKLSKSKPGTSFLKDANLAIIIMGNSLLSDVWIENASIAASNIHLTAHELGLGSCWIQIRNRNYTKDISAEEYIRSLLNIPENVNVLAIVAIGHPDEKKGSLSEDNLNYSKVFLNEYNKSLSL